MLEPIGRLLPLVILVALAAPNANATQSAPPPPSPDEKPSPDTDATARQLASVVAAKVLVAEPITEVLAGWIVGNDPNPHGGVECWDEPSRGLRVSLSLAGEPDPKKVIEGALTSSIPVEGLERVGEPIRGTSPLAEDAIHFVHYASAGAHTAFWVRSVRLGDGLDAPYLMATFRSAGGATLAEFVAEIVLRKESVRPAFDTILAAALRRGQTWSKSGDRFTLPLDGATLTMTAPAKWTRLESPDAVALWEGKSGRIRVTADVPRVPSEGRLAAAGAEKRAIVLHDGHRLLGEPALKPAAYEIAFVSRVDGEEKWTLVQLREAGAYIFELRADGTFPDPRKTAKLPDAARREVEKCFSSFKLGKG